MSRRIRVNVNGNEFCSEQQIAANPRNNDNIVGNGYVFERVKKKNGLQGGIFMLSVTYLPIYIYLYYSKHPISKRFFKNKQNCLSIYNCVVLLRVRIGDNTIGIISSPRLY